MQPDGAAGQGVRLDGAAVVVLRLFDVADELDLALARRLLESDAPTAAGVRRRSALELPRPPLTVPLGRRELSLPEGPLPVELTARLFDFGAVGVRLRFSLGDGVDWSRASALLGRLESDEAVTALAREASERLMSRLGPALQAPHGRGLMEDYAVLWCTAVREGPVPAGWVARLLCGESSTAPLSADEEREALRHGSSYDGTDRCVPGWSAAFVVEPQGDPAVLELVELANAQLLVLRGYDRLLDGALDALYGDVARRRGRSRALRNYRGLLHRAMALMLELAELVERVENAIKVVGDTYLARLYGSVMEALRLPAWQRSVTRKQALLQQVYDVLKHEVDSSRALLVELLVVALILLEVIVAIPRH